MQGLLGLQGKMQQQQQQLEGGEEGVIEVASFPDMHQQEECKGLHPT